MSVVLGPEVLRSVVLGLSDDSLAAEPTSSGSILMLRSLQM